jgi:hypothetical protein
MSEPDTPTGPDADYDHPRRRLAESDLELVRALEDLIYVLIDKRVIAFTDLPPQVTDRLLERRELRSQLAALEGEVDDSGLVDL